jgi:hypothetical protein
MQKLHNKPLDKTMPVACSDSLQVDTVRHQLIHVKETKRESGRPSFGPGHSLWFFVRPDCRRAIVGATRAEPPPNAPAW